MKGMNMIFRHRPKCLNMPQYATITLLGNPQTPEPLPEFFNQIEKKRSEIFSKEQKKQHDNIGRIEKIEVQYKGLPEDKTLIMNKNVSTPHECAKHMTEMLVKRSVLAKANGHLWDMNRPLEESCELELLHLKDPYPFHANRAFWRSCSFMLGAVARNAFKEEVQVHLHSFPSPNVRSGSFVYDVDIDMKDWKPTSDEMRILTAQFLNLANKDYKFERLVVSAKVAEEMFVDNPHKLKQIPQIASQLDDKVVLYRLGHHVDISKGPLIGSSGHIGRCTLASVHKIASENGYLYRFQGVALPKGFLLNHFAYGVLEDRAKKLNSTTWIPASQMQEQDLK